VSRKLWLKRASKFRKCASGEFGMLLAFSEALDPKRASKFLKCASRALLGKARVLPRGTRGLTKKIHVIFIFLS
jgi:hypothetical protein